MNFKRLIASVMTASMVISTGSTMSFAKSKKKAQAKVTLNKKAMKLKKGKKFTLKLTGSKASGKASVSNKKIVKLTAVKKKKKIVKNQWIITALKVGKAKITVKANKKKYICNVTVTEQKVKSKTKAKTKKTKAQDTQKLADQTAANKVIQMINALPEESAVTSTNKEAIQKAYTAYQNLSVAQTALVPGNVYTKLIKDYNKSNTLSVTEKASKDATNGPKTQTVDPDKTVADNVTAMINNLPSVNLLTVNDANRVFAATYAYNALTNNQRRFIDTATYNKLVEAWKLEKQETAKANTKINFTNSEKTIDITVNDKKELYYSLVSTYYHDSDVVFKSSDDKIATVDSNGKVTGVSKGTATITASVGDHSDQLTVNVHALTITFPQLPKTILVYDSRGLVKNSCEINNLSIEYGGYDLSAKAFFSMKLNYVGKKTWNTSIANTSCEFGFKLYNSNNVVVDSGTIYTTSIANGESFSGYTYFDASLPDEDTYRLELLNVA